MVLALERYEDGTYWGLVSILYGWKFIESGIDKKWEIASKIFNSKKRYRVY